MPKITLLVLSALILFSCGKSGSAAVATVPVADSVAIAVADSPVSPPVVTDTMPAKTTEESAKIAVSGKAVYSTSYCGGAAPPRELLEELRKWKPLINAEIVFKAGGKEVKVRTDSQGAFTTSLRGGIWKYYLTSNLDKDFKAINVSCEKYFEKSYGEINVIPTGKEIKHQLEYHFVCDPCDPFSKRRP